MSNENLPNLQDIKSIKKETEGLGSCFKQLVMTTKEWRQQLATAGKFYLGLKLADDLAGVAKKMFDINSELHRTAINSGLGKEGVVKLQREVNTLSKALGATQEEANKIVKTLSSRQFLGTAEEFDLAAKSSFAFSKAMGLSQEEIANVTVELQKWGQVSASTTTAMYADITKVAQANGLTKEGAKTVLESTTQWSGILKAFGKGSTEVQKYNMSLAKTTSAFEKVGISADKTKDMLENLMDPENIEQNIPRFAALGISISDAISGNITSEKMAGGLKEFGEKLKEMGPIAGASYAKAMGVSYKEAIKATMADTDLEVDVTPEQKAQKELEESMKNTMDYMENIKKKISEIGGRIRDLGPIVLAGIQVFRGLLMSGFSKFIKDTKGEAMVASKDVANYLEKVMEDVNKKARGEFEPTIKGLFDKIARSAKTPDEMLNGINKNLISAQSALAKEFDGVDKEYRKAESAVNHLNKLRAKGEAFSENELKTQIERMKTFGNQKENLSQQLNLITSITDEFKDIDQEGQFSIQKLGIMNEKLKGMSGISEDVKKDFEQMTDPSRFETLSSKMKNKFTEMFAGIKKNITGLAKDFGKELEQIPGVGKLFSKTGDFVKSITTKIEAAFNARKQDEGSSGGGLGSLMPPWLKFLLPLLMPLILILKEKIQPVMDVVSSFINDIGKTLSPTFESISKVLVDLLKPVLEILKPFLDLACFSLNIIVSLLKVPIKILTFIANIFAAIAKSISTAVKIVYTLINGVIGEGIRIIANVIKKSIKPAVDFIKDKLKAISDKIEGIKRSFVEFVRRFSANAADKLEKILFDSNKNLEKIADNTSGGPTAEQLRMAAGVLTVTKGSDKSLEINSSSGKTETVTTEKVIDERKKEVVLAESIDNSDKENTFEKLNDTLTKLNKTLSKGKGEDSYEERGVISDAIRDALKDTSINGVFDDKKFQMGFTWGV